MIFEEAYGRWLVMQINERVNNVLKKTCKQYDEVAFKPLRKNPDEIAIVINGGGAARSAVQGQDQNSLSVNVVIVCKKDYAKTVRACIESFQVEYNAKPMELSYRNENNDEEEWVNQIVKSVFFTPITLDANDYPTSGDTIKVTFLSFTVSVLYGHTAIVAPAEFKLTVGGEEYPINFVSVYDLSTQPAYDTFLSQGDYHPQQTPVSLCHAYSLTMIKVNGKDDKLQQLLRDELRTKKGLFGKNITFTIMEDGERFVIPIRTYQLTESYVNNATAYNLVLGY